MISHIRIQNLRSLVDTGFIEIKPLTILLGANSSGKSTFLRSFPLFSQSVTKSLREPISWFDDALVDFGDFETARSRMANEGEGIIFSYKFPELESYIFDRRYHPRLVSNINFFAFDEITRQSTLEISYQKDQKGTYVNKVRILKDNLDIEFYIIDRNANVSITVNGVSVLGEEKLKWIYGPNRVLFPEFVMKSNQEDTMVKCVEQELCYVARDFIRQFCSSRLKNEDKVFQIIGCWKADKEEFLGALLDKAKTSTFRRNISKWTTSNGDFLYLYNILAVMNSVACFVSYDYELRCWYGDCSYIAPIRAAANRFYRTQGLQVRDVDPYGKNLQEFIISLTGAREKSYREFTERVLGLTIRVKNKTGHQQKLKNCTSPCF